MNLTAPVFGSIWPSRIAVRSRGRSTPWAAGLWAAACVALCASAVSVAAQVVNPATQGPPPTQAPVTQTPPASADARRRSFEMAPVDVYAAAPLKEEDLIGTYGQPRWTAARRFGETRVYVVPKGTVEFEYWLTPERNRDGVTVTESQYEFEFGLPHRFQLDLYAVGHQTGNAGLFGIDQQKVEVRYALADWDKIWGNPTLYAEWKSISGAPAHFEGKLLLGGQFRARWHWGSNLVWEHETGGEHENSNEWTTGVSYTLADTKASVGLETQLALVNREMSPGIRGPFSTELLVGPSLQFRPLPQVHLDVVPLFGVTDAAPRLKMFVVFGWEF